MDVMLQGPVLLQGYLEVSKEPFGCSLGYLDWLKRSWVVLRPWSICVYESPQKMTMQRAPVLISTSNIWRVSEALESDAVIQVRTLDFSWYSFSIPDEEGNDVNHDVEMQDCHVLELEVWRVAFMQASQRIESLAS